MHTPVINSNVYCQCPTLRAAKMTERETSNLHASFVTHVRKIFLEPKTKGLSRLYNILKKVIPKLGPWNRICNAKREYSEGMQQHTSTAGTSTPNVLPIRNSDPLEDFLNELGIQEYLNFLRAEKIGVDELMTFSVGKLRGIFRKMGPINKIMKARRKMKSRNPDDNTTSEVEEENQTLNILLLGETGVGKSTFINAFANYLTFDTLEEAKSGEMLTLIAPNFAVTDEQFHHHKVAGCDDVNENKTSGQSATQVCKSYLFPFEHLSIRLIDTPGIGDTRGIQQDKINLDNILAFIGKHTDLHGICILMKPNNSRLTVSFTFCIKELLCHLQKDAARNIMFVFTNSRSTFYKPGDTVPTLKTILDGIEKSPPHVRIPFVKETVYCYDNESFRFLMALNKGIQFQENQDELFSDSWKISVQECKRMIEHIATLTPHKVQDTVSINEARRLIIELYKPIADIAQNIIVNLQVIEDKRKELLLMDKDMHGLEKKLLVPVIDLEQRPFSQPRTVCTAPKCIEVRTVGPITKTNYKQKCHDPCYLTGVRAELVNNPALLECDAMKGKQKCQRCYCSYKLHMHIYYECYEVEKQIEDSTIKELIKQKAGGKALIAQSIQTLEKRSKALENEKDLLTKCTAKFAVFLKINAITPYNDSFQDYLQHLISNERTKASMSGASNLRMIEGLEKMLGAYIEEKRILDMVLADENLLGVAGADASILTPGRIKALEQELYAMNINGARLKHFRDAYQAARQREHCTYSETVHKPPPCQGGAGQNVHWVNSIWNGLKKVGNIFH